MTPALVLYFILAYALSWCVFIPLALQAQGLLSGVAPWLHLAGAYGPALAALVVTALTKGRAGLRELFSRMGRWRIGWGWMVVALLSPLAIYLATALVLGLVTRQPLALGTYGSIAELPGVSGLAGWLVWILTFGLGEETGWRGFALPRLQKTYSAAHGVADPGRAVGSVAHPDLFLQLRAVCGQRTIVHHRNPIRLGAALLAVQQHRR